MPPRVLKCPQVKLMNAPMGECWALKLMLPVNGPGEIDEGSAGTAVLSGGTRGGQAQGASAAPTPPGSMPGMACAEASASVVGGALRRALSSLVIWISRCLLIE